MTITTKKEIDNKVYFMYSNKICCGKIIAIKLKIAKPSGTSMSNISKVFESYNIDYGASEPTSNIELVFDTKEELMAHLSESGAY